MSVESFCGGSKCVRSCVVLAIGELARDIVFLCRRVVRRQVLQIFAAMFGCLDEAVDK